MDDVHHRYPPLSRRQVALFERNPVCELCFHVCLDLSEEYGGGIHFELLQSLEAADSFCERIILNPWELLEIDQYYHWLERQLDHSKPAVTCAFATISVTLSCMDGLPEPVLKLSHDLRGLIGGGQGGELYDNLRSAARYNDILIHADTYGDIPPQPDLQRELEQFKDAYNQAASEIITLKKQLQMKEQQPIQPSAPVINVAGDYIANQHNEYHTDIHDNHNCPIYACPTKNSSSISPESNSETDSTSPSQSACAMFTCSFSTWVRESVSMMSSAISIMTPLVSISANDSQTSSVGTLTPMDSDETSTENAKRKPKSIPKRPSTVAFLCPFRSKNAFGVNVVKSGHIWSQNDLERGQ